MKPQHDTEQMWVEYHLVPTPSSSPWAKQQPQPQAVHQELVGDASNTHLLHLTDSPAVLAKRTRKEKENLPFSLQ